ncbi:MAG: hypothetical protein U9P82_09735 [Bacteroidota bacterium]|nr:hypothetical protein [Bacteroidota bacterium]
MFKLKSKLIIAVMVMFGITAFMSCEKKKAVNLESNKDEIASLKMAGIEHNKGLDYVLQELKTTSQNKHLNLKSSNDIFSLVKTSTKDFLIINSDIISSSNNDYAIECAENAFDWVESNHSESNTKSITDDNSYYSSIEDSLSLNQKELLNIINDAINDIDLDLEATLSVFETVRNRANTELNEDERIPIIAAIEIGSNSMIYWSENIDEWAEVFSNGNKSAKGWFNWKKVGGADVKGAVTGGVTGAITGAGAGIGALGGGVGASAGQAALELWNHWVN